MTNHLVFSHSTDMMTPEDAMAVYNDTIDGFMYKVPDLAVKASFFNDFIKDINTKVCEMECFDYSKTKNNVFQRHLGDSVRMYISGNSSLMYFNVMTTSEKLANDIWNIYLEYSEDDDEVEVFMHSYYMNNNQLDSSTKKLEHKELKTISEKYYPYIDTNIMFDQFFTGSENIMLLVGNPGLGKSKMATLALKHAIDNPNILPYDKIEENEGLDSQFVTVVYVKSTDVLVNDKFWRELAKQQVDFCIIDDLDYMLTKRDAEVQSTDDANKNAFLNQFLSFTDGVEKFNTKFIITTNQQYDDIDTALLRKGRLFDILELRELNHQEALDIWESNNLSVDLFEQNFTDDKILPAELGSEISKQLNTRIGTATKSYLKETNISKVKKAGRNKKIVL